MFVLLGDAEIMPEGKSRNQIQKEIKEKQNAVKTLARKYAGKDTQRSSPGFFGLRKTAEGSGHAERWRVTSPSTQMHKHRQIDG